MWWSRAVISVGTVPVHQFLHSSALRNNAVSGCGRSPNEIAASETEAMQTWLVRAVAQNAVGGVVGDIDLMISVLTATPNGGCVHPS
jgi:hypothetical protein